MILNAKLNGNTLALLDNNETIILPENELIIALSTDVYTLYTLVITAKNDKRKLQFKTSDKHEIDLTELLTPGVIEIEISNIRKGEAVKSWRIENIYIKEIEHKFEIVPEISELQNQIKETKGAIAELVSLLQKNNIV